MNFKTTVLSSFSILLLFALFSAGAHGADDVTRLDIQERFDYIGPVIHSMDLDERPVYYIDEGANDGIPVVFLGGWGTSLEGFSITEFLRSLRLALDIRVISVERNGLGQSPFDPELGFDDYNREVLAVLDKLDVDQFHIVAISGGGTFAAHLASAAADRVLSVHLAAASASQLTSFKGEASELGGQTLGIMTAASADSMANYAYKVSHDVLAWWTVAESSPARQIPGWQERAYLDGLRAFYMEGPLGSPLPVLHDYYLFMDQTTLVDPSDITAPVFLYYGGDDPAVTKEHYQAWQAVPDVVNATLYPGIGHTVQYRHWGQILLDIATGGGFTLTCHDETSKAVPEAQITDDDFLGICAWQTK